MPVTEFAILPFIPPHTPLTDGLPKHFRSLIQQQSAWSKYPLRFFSDLENPSMIYLLTGWEDVEAHQRWMASDEDKALIGIFAPYMNMQSLRLLHFDVDFATFPDETAAYVVVRKYEGEVNGAGKLEVGKTTWKAVMKDLESAAGDVYLICAYEEREDIVIPSQNTTDLMVMQRLAIPEEGPNN